MVKTLIGTPDPERKLTITFTGAEAARIRRIARRFKTTPRDMLLDTVEPVTVINFVVENES
jgi:hypothetical protein